MECERWIMTQGMKNLTLCFSPVDPVSSLSYCCLLYMIWSTSMDTVTGIMALSRSAMLNLNSCILSALYIAAMSIQKQSARFKRNWSWAVPHKIVLPEPKIWPALTLAVTQLTKPYLTLSSFDSDSLRLFLLSLFAMSVFLSVPGTVWQVLKWAAVAAVGRAKLVTITGATKFKTG